MTLRVRALNSERTIIHRWRNFGETVCTTFQDDPRIEVDMNEVERSVYRFHLLVRAGLKKRVRAEIHAISQQHLMTGKIAHEWFGTKSGEKCPNLGDA